MQWQLCEMESYRKQVLRGEVFAHLRIKSSSYSIGSGNLSKPNGMVSSDILQLIPDPLNQSPAFRLFVLVKSGCIYASPYFHVTCHLNESCIIALELNFFSLERSKLSMDVVKARRDTKLEDASEFIYASSTQTEEINKINTKSALNLFMNITRQDF